MRSSCGNLVSCRWLGSRFIAAEHRLIEVDDRSGHEAGLLAGEVSYGARHFLHFDQAPKRQTLFSGGFPAVLRAVISAHDAVLSRRIHPTDVEAVDADAVAQQAERHVLRKR